MSQGSQFVVLCQYIEPGSCHRVQGSQFVVLCRWCVTGHWYSKKRTQSAKEQLRNPRAGRTTDADVPRKIKVSAVRPIVMIVLESTKQRFLEDSATAKIKLTLHHL